LKSFKSKKNFFLSVSCFTSFSFFHFFHQRRTFIFIICSSGKSCFLFERNSQKKYLKFYVYDPEKKLYWFSLSCLLLSFCCCCFRCASLCSILFIFQKLPSLLPHSLERLCFINKKKRRWINFACLFIFYIWTNEWASKWELVYDFGIKIRQKALFIPLQKSLHARGRSFHHLCKLWKKNFIRVCGH
jgi:hypothetical protein